MFLSVSGSFSSANFRSNSNSSANFLSQHFLNSHWKNSIYSGSLSSASLNSFSENFTYSGSFASISFSCWENFNYLGSFPSIPLNSCWENSRYSGSSPRTSLNSCWKNFSYWGKNLHPLFPKTLETFQYSFGCWEHFRPAFLLLYGQCWVELLCCAAVVYADYNYFQVSNDFQTHLLFQWGQKSNCSWEQQCFQPKLMTQIMSKPKKPHF